MTIRELPYHLRLCVELMFYAAFDSPQTREMTGVQVRQNLALFFPLDVVEEAVAILSGGQPETAMESMQQNCKHEYEWATGGGDPAAPSEPERVCRHCGAVDLDE